MQGSAVAPQHVSCRAAAPAWQFSNLVACLVAGCLIGLSAQCELLADDNDGAIPLQLKTAQANALTWWRDSSNHITTVESTHTNRDGNRERTVVFILRDPNGRSLAVSRAGTVELQTFFQQRLHQRLTLAAQQHGLTEEQLDKLKLAADLDIGRFHRRVQEAEQNLNTPAALEDVRSFKRHLSSISQECDGELFGVQSLFGRVLATLLATK